MADAWILEPKTGRYYIQWKDEKGRTLRQYAERPEAEQSSASQAAPAQSSKERDRIPRSSSSRSQGHTTYSSGRSSRQPTSKGQTRRNSTTTRRDLIPEESYTDDDRSDQTRQYESSKTSKTSKTYYPPEGNDTTREPKAYHISGGYGASQETRAYHTSGDYETSREVKVLSRSGDYGTSPAYHPSGGYGASQETKAYHTSGDYETSREVKALSRPGDYGTSPAYGDPGPSDWVQPGTSATDTLSSRMRALTVDEAGGGGQYTTISSSLPARGNSWAVATSSRYDEQTNTNENKGQTSAQVPRRYIAGNPKAGNAEKLDKSYQIRNYDYKKFFRVGRVFSTLWTDTVSSTAHNVDPTFISVIIYDERVYSKVRRFVVVRENDRSCTCLPVTSYDGKGHKKGQINLSEHSFIYSIKAPKQVEGITKKPLRVILSKGAADLQDPSLVNYVKVYTVETNVKVKDVGELDQDSKTILRHNFRTAFFGGDDEPANLVPDMTPRTRDAVLAGVGGATYSYPATSQSGSYAPSVPPAVSYNAPAGYNTPAAYRTAGEYGATVGAPAYATNPSAYATGHEYDVQRFEATSHYPSTPTSGGYDTQGTASSRSYQPMNNRYVNVSTSGNTGTNTYAAGGSSTTGPAYFTSNSSGSINYYPAPVTSGGPNISHGSSASTHHPSSNAAIARSPYASPSDYKPLNTYGFSSTHHDSDIREEEIELPSLDIVTASRGKEKGKEKKRRHY